MAHWGFRRRSWLRSADDIAPIHNSPCVMKTFVPPTRGDPSLFVVAMT